jgi:hypothetical protein
MFRKAREIEGFRVLPGDDVVGVDIVPKGMGSSGQYVFHLCPPHCFRDRYGRGSVIRPSRALAAHVAGEAR